MAVVGRRWLLAVQCEASVDLSLLCLARRWIASMDPADSPGSPLQNISTASRHCRQHARQDIATRGPDFFCP